MRTENPYQSPSADAEPVTRSVDGAKVARYRRRVVVCMVGQAVYYLLYALQLDPKFSELDLLLQIALHVMGSVPLLGGAIATGLLAGTIYHPIAAVLLGVAAFYPVLGFVPMAWLMLRTRQVLPQTGLSGVTEGAG